MAEESTARAWDAEPMRLGEKRDPASFATGPSVADDPLTKLWQGADASHQSGADAVVELRERMRQAKDSEQPPRRRRHR